MARTPLDLDDLDDLVGRWTVLKGEQWLARAGSAVAAAIPAPRALAAHGDTCRVDAQFVGVLRGPHQGGVAVFHSGRVGIFGCQPVFHGYDRAVEVERIRSHTGRSASMPPEIMPPPWSYMSAGSAPVEERGWYTRTSRSSPVGPWIT